MIQTQQMIEKSATEFAFTSRARRFPVMDARPYRWPSSAALADEYIADWLSRAGKALGRHKLSKATMLCIASHISRKDGTCPLSDRALSVRSRRSIPSTKRDICRLKKMGFLIAETDVAKGYRNRKRRLILALPDRIDDDQRILHVNHIQWGSTYPLYVDPIDKGESRNV